MQSISGSSLAKILQRTLNLVDYRLVDHGERLAYLVLKMLLEEGGHSPGALAQICYLCMLHDIGAFKTEHIDSLSNAENLFAFELQNTVAHSAYGYLFLKNFSCLATYAEAVLYHHLPYEKLQRTTCTNKALAAKMFLADRVDVLFLKDRLTMDEHLFAGLGGRMFCEKDISLLLALEKNYGIQQKLRSGEYLEELLAFLDTVELPWQQQLSLLQLLAYSIDFRSPYTVMHTITMVAVSLALAKLLGVSQEDYDKIHLGALLHDVGKIATPVIVLEKSERLDDFEFHIIQDHVVVSEQILQGLLPDDILHIAIRHHEKLDGSGYPYGLSAEQLNQNERIVAVADILSALVGKRSYKDSFPEEKIRHILQDMADQGKLCSHIVNVVLQSYRQIMNEAFENSLHTLEQYQDMGRQYQQLLAKSNDIFQIGRR